MKPAHDPIIIISYQFNMSYRPTHNTLSHYA